MGKYFLFGSAFSLEALAVISLFSGWFANLIASILLFSWLAAVLTLLVTNAGAGSGHWEPNWGGRNPYYVVDVSPHPQLAGFSLGIFLTPLIFVAEGIIYYIIYY